MADGTRVVDEEQVGPVVPVIQWSDMDDAVERASACPCGVGGSVWAADVAKAGEVAQR